MSGTGASLNDPYAPSGIIRPRLRVLFDGVEVPTPLSASVDQNNAFHADRFSVAFVPPLSGTGSVAWWAAMDASDAVNLLDVQIGLLSPGSAEGQGIAWQSMVQGEADRFTYSTRNNTVTVQGHDLTARMIDTKTQDAYANQTSSEIVTAIANKHGLTPVVTATTTLAGRYWSADHDAIQLNQFHHTMTEWDLIVSLARLEMFDAFVVGTELHFQPYAKPSDVPYVMLWQQDQYGTQTGNVPDLSFERAFTVAKGIQVIVKSWSGKQKRSFQRAAGLTTQTGQAGGTGGNGQQYVYIIPDLTEDQAQQRANAIYADIIKHEFVVRATDMQGDTILTPRVIVRLDGTGTKFDQIYYPVSVTRRISMSGYTMSCEVRTTNPQTEATGSPQTEATGSSA